MMKTRAHVESYINWLVEHDLAHHFDDKIEDIPTLAHIPHLQDLDDLMWSACNTLGIDPFDILLEKI